MGREPFPDDGLDGADSFEPALKEIAELST
jgi:hypothetical protein